MPKGARKETAKSMTLAKQREHDALQLRQRGYTYERIAEALGMSTSGACDSVRRALQALKADTAEKAEEVRDLELRRLDRMLDIAQTAAEQGDLAAIDRVLRIQERRSKYLGLDAPTRSETSATVHSTVRLDGVTDEQLSALERAYLEITGGDTDAG